jgi:condensin complex subunit 1
MGDLEPGRYRVRREELRNFIKNNLPENIQEAHEAALEEAIAADDVEARVEIVEATIAAAIADIEAYQDEDELTENHELLRNKVQALKFTQSCLDFIELFENANDTFNFMLHSKLQSDVTEALRFYVQARHFKLPCAISGMKNALTLMWSTEQPIRDECRKTFVEIFLAEPGSEGKRLLSNDKIAENLIVLVGEATVSELASIEEGIISLVKDEMIPADVFLTLWWIVSKGSMEAKSSAMQVISMGASADKSIIDSKSRLKLLLDSCLGDDTEHVKDWRLARTSACALQKIDRAVPDEECAKYLVLERILEQLATVVRGDWCSDDDRDTLEWFSASEEAVKALFVISPNPEEACSDIVRVLYASTFRNVEGSACHSLRLARFFHVLGNIALNLLCYTEELSSGVRQANAKKTLSKQVEADTKKAKKKKQQPQGTPRSSDSESEDEIEAELGIAAEVEAETERQMSEITEREILGKGLIHAFAPLLVKIVGNEGGKFGFEILMQASMLCLCKFMCVSAAFCEKHLPLVFSALSRAEGDTMKANTVVALGDLAFRFPNSFEPYTAHLYTCLRDPSTKVRRHTLMVLTHLILNDMIKLRTGQGEIVLCLQDEDGRIRDMAGLLFHSLASRSNNPIYNLLPDIISQLSQCDISRESFRSIMVFLLGFVQKERQSTMLTEKLTLRMEKASTISHKADLAYCISQLKQNEKSIKYLVENFKLYKDSLFDEEVSRSFISVIAKTKKSAKPELKALLEDWEGRIKESSELSKEDNATDTKAAKAARRRRTAKKKKPASKRDSEHGVEVESEKENNLQEAPALRSRRTARKKPTKKMVSDDDEADLESEKENNNLDDEDQAPSRRRANKIDQPEMMDIDAPRRRRRAGKK